MKKLFFVCFAFFFCSFISTTLAACGSASTCKDCLLQDDCGWCSASRLCVPGNQTGPAGASCYGASWHFGDPSVKCPDCQSLTDCRSCLEYNTDCFWCDNPEGGSKCYDTGGHLGCQNRYQDSCPCNLFSYSCSTCVEDSRGECAFCRETLECVPRTNAECRVLDNQCACEQIKDCTTCSSTAGCNWCSDKKACKPTSEPCLTPHTCQSYCESVGAAGCGACNNLTGCGWCSAEQKCFDITTASCVIQHTCPRCEAHTNCNSCSLDSSCTWCSNSKNARCIGKGTDPSCAVPHNCDNYCGIFSNCDSCSVKSGCGWCTHEGKCKDLSTASCTIATVCPAAKSSGGKKGGFDGGSFVGGMFLVIGILALGGAAFLVYRWKFSQQGKYTELS